MSDRLPLADAIEDASIERGKAERVASIIVDATLLFATLHLWPPHSG